MGGGRMGMGGGLEQVHLRGGRASERCLGTRSDAGFGSLWAQFVIHQAAASRKWQTIQLVPCGMCRGHPMLKVHMFNQAMFVTQHPTWHHTTPRQWKYAGPRRPLPLPMCASCNPCQPRAQGPPP